MEFDNLFVYQESLAQQIVWHFLLQDDGNGNVLFYSSKEDTQKESKRKKESWIYETRDDAFSKHNNDGETSYKSNQKGIKFASVRKMET